MKEKKLYSDIVISHYQKPHNYGVIKNTRYRSEAANQICGDEIKVYLAIKNGKILDAKFEGRGCALMLAAASLLSDKIKSDRADDLAKIKEGQIAALLGCEIPKARTRCAMLAAEAFCQAAGR